MKCFVVLTAAILFANVNCGIIIGSGSSLFLNGDGKFNIVTREDGLHCGPLVCPINSRCLITQKNSENDKKILVTTTKCFDSEYNLLKENKTEEETSENNIVNTRIESGGIGGIGGTFISDPKLAGEIEKDVQDAVRKTLDETLGSVQTSLTEAFNGPFFRNGFGDSFPFGPRNNPFGPNFPFSSNPFGPGFPFNNRPEVDVVIYPEYDVRTGVDTGKDDDKDKKDADASENNKPDANDNKSNSNAFNNFGATGTDMGNNPVPARTPESKKSTREDLESDEANEVGSL